MPDAAPELRVTPRRYATSQSEGEAHTGGEPKRRLGRATFTDSLLLAHKKRKYPDPCNSVQAHMGDVDISVLCL